MIKLVHRFWAGTEMPEQYRLFGEEWEKMNPGWEVIDWTEETLMALPNLQRGSTGQLVRNPATLDEGLAHYARALALEPANPNVVTAWRNVALPQCDLVREALVSLRGSLLSFLLALAVAARDLVELILHLSGKGVAHIGREVVFEPSGHDHAGRGRLERARELLDIAAILDGLHDRGIRRRSADAAFLELFDEAGFGVAVGRGGFFSLGGNRNECQRIGDFYCR